MTESNDITQKSAMGIIVIIIALILLILFGVFLVLNLRHWKTQTYKIRVIQRQAALRSKMKKKKLSESEQEKEVNSTEFKHFVLNEMIKIVIRMNSLRFRTVYWITCDKYYHIAIWCYLEIAKLCSKCRKKNVTVQNNDKDAEHGQHFNLLKPMSRFYHFINLSGIVTMWLIVNLIIAVLVKFENSNESISVANFMIGVLISTIVGNILIMLITKLLHILYMKNIEDSFAQQEVDMKFSKDKLFNETQKSETSPMLLNEYIQETQQSKDNREISSRTSSQRPETARGLVGPMRPLSRSRKDTKVIPVEKSEEEKEDKKEIKLEYLGDIDLLQDESKKSNNFINTSIFMTIFGFMAFFSLFCCIYAYSEYSQSVILSSLLMMLVAALAEVLLLRPLSCFAMTLVIMVKRKVKSKEIMMREIEEVKEELDLNSSYFKDKSDEISKENQEEDHKDEKVEIIQFNPNPDVEESKETENKVQADIESQNKSATIDKLKQDAIIEKIAKRPEKKKPAESRSEAAKIARYNIQLLENIYKAYEPEQADHVVKIFRKGGIFNIVPIIEEENEDSIDTYNQEIIPFGVGTNCYSAAPDLESQTTETNRNFDTNKDPNGLNTKLSGKDLAYSSGKLGDIKEENSQLLDELIDEKFRRDYNRKASDETGFDFEEGKNKNTGRTKAQGENFEAKAFEAQQSDSDDGWKKENKYGDSTSFDEETPLGAITLNERKKRKKRRLKRKKNDDGVNAKIRQLEEIYDVKLNDDNVSKVNKSQLGGELTSRNTFRNTFRNKNTAIIKRETTVKLSESASPRNINDITAIRDF